ncbi:MAG TPA: plastocyanin/azurin family copper-binding protein [Ktedonobacteraceae bacterium]
MAKKHLQTVALFLAIFALGSMLLMACSRPGTASSGGSSSSNSTPSSSSNTASCPTGDTVKTGTSTFEQTCITLAKGGTLKIVQDQSSYHVFDYGKWNGSSQAKETPANAPAIKDLTLSGASVSVGPFTAAGTYHIYCTVHPGMDLTVVVK